MTANALPATAVVRVSSGTFDPARFAEVVAMNASTGRYLVPAVQSLPGLIGMYTGVSPAGSISQISIWDTEDHAKQLNTLKEMAVIARGEAQAAGVTFLPIVHYPVGWTI